MNADTYKIVTTWTKHEGQTFLTVVVPDELMGNPLARFELFRSLELEAGTWSREKIKGVV